MVAAGARVVARSRGGDGRGRVCVPLDAAALAGVAPPRPASLRGQLEPVLNTRGFVPNGTATAEGGAVIGDPVNLFSQRVQIDVRFSLPIGCNGTCLESAGVAFTAKEPDEFVDAEVGLLLSGSREVVSLMIGNAVARKGSRYNSSPSLKLRRKVWQVVAAFSGPWGTPLMTIEQLPQIPSRQS